MQAALDYVLLLGDLSMLVNRECPHYFLLLHNKQFMVQIYYNLFKQYFIDGLLGCFQSSVITNNVAKY